MIMPDKPCVNHESIVSSVRELLLILMHFVVLFCIMIGLICMKMIKYNSYFCEKARYI